MNRVESVSKNVPLIELLDTTLRDGEQTSGVAFAAQEKLNIARFMLEELGIDRIEVASARVSEGEFETVRCIMSWAAEAGFLDKIEVLGFVDGGKSLQWIKDAGGRVINLLAKGSYKHVTEQLHKTPEEHIADIQQMLAFAADMGFTVNLYLEDWSNGIQNSPNYVWQMMDALADSGIQRFMLPDTLGILSPQQSFDYVREMKSRYPSVRFDFHAHNDYDMAVANTCAAIDAGARCVHVTVNGLGERAGNAPLTSVVAVIHDQLKYNTNIQESTIYQISKLG